MGRVYPFALKGALSCPSAILGQKQEHRSMVANAITHAEPMYQNQGTLHG
ncbi:MAG: hypothetical protein M3Y56_02320 [Armatimonadota bacterium]|nr:hypothetical protein [Armatimonadota bacterium]